MVSREQFQEFKHDMEVFMAATQADIDALNAQGEEIASLLGTVQADVAAAASAIETALNDAQSGLDVSALQATLAPLAEKVGEIDTAVKALVPAPAAAAEPAPAEAAPATDSSQLPKPVYTTTEPPAAVDLTAWTVSGYETVNDPSGAAQPLYFFNADADGTDATGGSDTWTVYQGAVAQVPASS